MRAARLAAERDALTARLDAARDTLDLLRRPGVRVYHIPVASEGREGSVTIFVDEATHRWLVSCHNLAPNAPGQAYQLWFVTETGMLVAHVMAMRDDRPMVAAVPMPGGGGRVMGAAMSIEREGGSSELRGPLLFKRML